MPTKITKTQKSIEAAAALPPVPKELIDLFCTGPMTGEAVNTATVAFKKALIERALGGELSHHLGYARGDAKPDEATNHRNGDSGKGRADRRRAAAYRGAARPHWQFRAAADP